MRILERMISQPASIVSRVVLAALAALSLAACSSNPVSHDHVGHRAAAVAAEQVGVPYRYGGSSPSGFDCSGLVYYSYAAAGIRVPRTTSGQWAQMSRVSDTEMRAGDVLFFEISGKMSHVGLYLGNGRFVHAPSSGRTVAIESLNSRFYSDALVRAGRPR
jgi:cell wall-associated NlpC family hydrolase